MKTLLSTSVMALALIGCGSDPDISNVIPTDIYVALPSQNIGVADDVISVAVSAFEQTGPGERLRVLDVASGASVTTMEVADKTRFETQKFKAKEYGQELGELQAFVRDANALPVIEYTEFKSDIPSVLQAVGTMRGGDENPAKLIIIGGGLQMTPDNPTTSMYVDGRSLVASDTLLTDTLLTSSLGLGYGQNYLSGVDVYYCAVLPDGLTPYELQEIGRMWGHYVGLRQGRLMAFTPDVDLCVEQFTSGHGEPLALRPLDPDIEPAMIAADKSGKIKRITATEAEAHRAEVAAIAAERDAERQARVIAEQEAEIERNKPPQIITKTVTKTVYDDGARFEHITHPTLSYVRVSTGVEYSQAAKHGYINAWCYMQFRSKRGVKVWLDIGTQNAGRRARYDRPDKAMLREAGMSERDFLAARQACRFPQ